MNINNFETIAYFIGPNIPDADFTADSDSLEVKVFVTQYNNTEEILIFNETLFRESDGKIWLRDLYSLLKDYCQRISNVKISFDDDFVNFFFVESNLLLSGLNGSRQGDAIKFFQENFLLSNPTMFAPLDEIVHIVFYEQRALVDTVAFNVAYKEDRKFKTAAITKPIESSYVQFLASTYNPVDLTFVPKNILDELQIDMNDVLSFNVTIGHRDCKIVHTSDADVLFMYKNCFGYFQNMLLQCSLTEEPELSYTSTTVLGKKVLVDNKMEKKFEIQTGPISNERYKSIVDIGNSDKIYMLHPESNELIEVIPDSIEAKWNYDKTEYNAVSFSVYQTDKFRRLTCANVKSIFDQTFDKSFE